MVFSQCFFPSLYHVGGIQTRIQQSHSGDGELESLPSEDESEGEADMTSESGEESDSD